MASNTERLDLHKKDPAVDGNDTFNIDTMLNENWDKIDKKVAMVDEDGKVVNKDGSPTGEVLSVNDKKGNVVIDKDDVGLGNVDNVKQATKTEFDSHAENESNPHKVTKYQVGLGSVSNYGLATQSEAESGTSSTKYMTPQRTKQAIEKLSPEGVSEEDVDGKIATHAEETDVHGLDANNLVIGKDAETSSTGSTAIGRAAQALGQNATALGQGAQATGPQRTAVGQNAQATGNLSTAVGRDARASGVTSTAIGQTAWASGDTSTAIGQATRASGVTSTAIGQAASASNRGTSLGQGAQAYGSDSTAIGQDSRALGASTAIGQGAQTGGGDSTAIGRGAQTGGSGSTAIGCYTSALNAREGVLGNTAYTSGWKVPGSFTVEGTKNFEMPHPHPDKKESHRLRHSAVESPTAGDNLYRFEIEATEALQEIEYELPDYFQHLNKNVDVWVNGVDHFGNAYGKVEGNTLKVSCEYAGKYNVLVIGTRNDEHQSVQDWDIMGVEREIGESWTGETYVFEVDEILEIEEIKEEDVA